MRNRTANGDVHGDASRADLVILCEAPNEFAARSLVIVLEEAGIPAHTFGAGQLPNIPNLTTGKARGVAVHVARGDEAEARELLEDLPQRASDIDWDAIDVGDPNGDPNSDPNSDSDGACSSGACAPNRGRCGGTPCGCRQTGAYQGPSLNRSLLVIAGLGIALAIIGFLIEVFRRAS
ncbi:MAG: hypothetical protein JNL80_17965 [Phycisphaerae bacterium]|jgi:hypothetical protein|nr:hypothetical protein [Phycisphaerae bacterium]